MWQFYKVILIYLCAKLYLRQTSYICEFTKHTVHRKAARPIIAAPAIPIPVFIGAAAPEADAVAEALLATELAEDVAELATLFAELIALLTELWAELRADPPWPLAEESTLESELLIDDRRDDADDVTLETWLEMLELTDAATELRDAESLLAEEEPTGVTVEVMEPAVPWAPA